MITLQQMASQRIANELQMRGCDDSVADMLADIIHYCNANDLIFAEIMDQAEQYVNEDLSMDAEDANDNG